MCQAIKNGSEVPQHRGQEAREKSCAEFLNEVLERVDQSREQLRQDLAEDVTKRLCEVAEHADDGVDGGRQRLAEAQGGDNALDGVQDLGEELGGAAEKLVEVGAVDVDAYGAEDCLENDGELDVDKLKLLGHLCGCLILGDVTGFKVGNGSVL